MKTSYELWAAARMGARERCRVEGSMSCIPLRGDPICRECYILDLEAGESDEAEGAGHAAYRA